MKLHTTPVSSGLVSGVLGAIALIAVGSTPAAAHSLKFDQNVTPDAIFGGGNDNGGFTVQRRRGVEIGLRAKLRFNSSCLPENVFNSNGDGTYSFNNIDVQATHICVPPKSPGLAEWAFEWSVNTDFKGTNGRKLDAYRYELGMDGDPGVGKSYLSFDPIIVGPNGCADHSLGDNLTANGGGMEVPGDIACGDYFTALSENNVAQQSWRYTFFPLGPLNGFDPTSVGVYDIYLLAKDAKSHEVARTNIRILVGLPNGLPDYVKQCNKGAWEAYGSLFASDKECRRFVRHGW